MGRGGYKEPTYTCRMRLACTLLLSIQERCLSVCICISFQLAPQYGHPQSAMKCDNMSRLPQSRSRAAWIWSCLACFDVVPFFVVQIFSVIMKWSRPCDLECRVLSIFRYAQNGLSRIGNNTLLYVSFLAARSFAGTRKGNDKAEDCGIKDAARTRFDETTCYDHGKVQPVFRPWDVDCHRTTIEIFLRN